MEWLDLSGLILPAKILNKMLDDIENGNITNLAEIERFFQEIHARYYSLEWDWAYPIIEQFYGVNLQEITANDLIRLITQWKDSVIGLDHLLYQDAARNSHLRQ